jgi:hypothetical protein
VEEADVEERVVHGVTDDVGTGPYMDTLVSCFVRSYCSFAGGERHKGAVASLVRVGW